MTNADASGMAEAAQQLQRLRIEATKQGERVRLMQKNANYQSPAELEAEIAILTEIRGRVSVLEKQCVELKPSFYTDRQARENLLKRRFFIAPAFEIYGGVGGLYDFGPPGCALKNQVEALWRRHFILEEDMLEISGPCLTPYIVFKTSGHVDRFTDLMVKDVVTNECYRADKYLEECLDAKIEEIKSGKHKPAVSLDAEQSKKEIERFESIQRQADSYSADEMKKLFADLKIKSPKGNDLSDPFPFNLMFGLKIGPKDESDVNSAAKNGNSSNSAANQQLEGKAYLRPETAQGIFMNFRRLYEQNGGKMPFAAATLGLGFRNEIAPRNGLLRVREFQMAEIEHFCHPEKKDVFPQFDQYANVCLPIYPRKSQLTTGQVIRDMPIMEALKQGIVANRTLAYYLCRSYLFVKKCGIQEQHLRFRQHLESEMAHYANDCWDMEIETSYGWIEVAGHADRAAFDLSSHTRASKVDLFAMEKFDTPQIKNVVKLIPNKQLIGKTFKNQQQLVTQTLENLTDEEKLRMESELAQKGESMLQCVNANITREMCSFESAQVKISEQSYIPCVIEPSFGIGRILHCILEHVYYQRPSDSQNAPNENNNNSSEVLGRSVLSFPPCIAPVKVCILPLSNDAEKINPYIQTLRNDCIKEGVAFKVDDSRAASIGKRYARNDETGIPFAITIDFETHDTKSVTLRERDSMEQVRLPLSEAIKVVKELSDDILSWSRNVVKSYPSIKH